MVGLVDVDSPSRTGRSAESGPNRAGVGRGWTMGTDVEPRRQECRWCTTNSSRPVAIDFRDARDGRPRASDSQEAGAYLIPYLQKLEPPPASATVPLAFLWAMDAGEIHESSDLPGSRPAVDR